MAAAAIPDIGLSRDGDSRQLTAPHVVDPGGVYLGVHKNREKIKSRLSFELTTSYPWFAVNVRDPRLAKNSWMGQ